MSRKIRTNWEKNNLVRVAEENPSSNRLVAGSDACETIRRKLVAKVAIELSEKSKPMTHVPRRMEFVIFLTRSCSGNSRLIS